MAGLEGHKEQAGGLRSTVLSYHLCPVRTRGAYSCATDGLARDVPASPSARGVRQPTLSVSFDTQPEEVGCDLGFRRIGGKAVSHEDDMFFPNSYLVSSTRTLKKRKALRLKSVKGVQLVSSNRAFPRIV